MLNAQWKHSRCYWRDTQPKRGVRGGGWGHRAGAGHGAAARPGDGGRHGGGGRGGGHSDGGAPAADADATAFALANNATPDMYSFSPFRNRAMWLVWFYLGFIAFSQLFVTYVMQMK